VVIERGPCIVLEHWIYSSASWSVRGNRTMVVWIAVRAWYITVDVW
jgi:hypothetical protein